MQIRRSTPALCSTGGRPLCGTRSCSTWSGNSFGGCHQGHRRPAQGVTRGRLPTPAELLATDTENLRGVGLSRAKTVYLRDLAERLADGRLDLERLRKLDDDAARAELMQVKGVGRFTADGVLMFALRRPDIWPAANLALRRAVERVWELSAPASIADIDPIGDRFRPWRTLAALYLYRSGRREA
jgi:DNA-3-methyladenine glycosylase II